MSKSQRNQLMGVEINRPNYRRKEYGIHICARTDGVAADRAGSGAISRSRFAARYFEIAEGERIHVRIFIRMTSWGGCRCGISAQIFGGDSAVKGSASKHGARNRECPHRCRRPFSKKTLRPSGMKSRRISYVRPWRVQIESGWVTLAKPNEGK